MVQFLQWMRGRLAKLEPPALRVLACGAAGGVLSVVHDAVLGVELKPWYVMLGPSLVLGACAAFAAIFVLLGTKTDEVLRSSGVAVLAGFAWLPVLDAGKAYITGQTEQALEAEASRNADDLVEQTGEMDKGPANPGSTRRVGRLAESLTAQLAYLRPGPVKTRAQTAVNQSLDAITTKAGNDDNDAFGVVESVVETANRVGDQRISDRAWANVGRLPVTNNSAVDKRKAALRLRFPANR